MRSKREILFDVISVASILLFASGLCLFVYSMTPPTQVQAQVPAQGLNTKRFMLTNLQNMSVSTSTGNLNLKIVVLQDSLTGREFLLVDGGIIEIGGKK